MFEAGYDIATALFFLSPLWIPLAFVFYAIWREDLTPKMFIAFALAEVLSFGFSYYALRLVAFGA